MLAQESALLCPSSFTQFMISEYLSHADWQKQIDFFARVFRVIAPDLRGHGDSEGGGPFTVDRLATDCSQLLDELKVGSFFLIGHSMGGAVAMQLMAAQRQFFVARRAALAAEVLELLPHADTIIVTAKRNADEISLEVAAANENWVDALIESGLRAALDQPEGK